MMIDDETMNEEWENVFFFFFFLQRKFVDCALNIVKRNKEII